MARKRTIDYMIACTNSVGELFIWYAGALIVATISFSHFEDRTLWESFYWACVTATTTGYGDISPQTVGGRVVGIVLMNFMVLFILPLLIARLASAMMPNVNEFTNAEQEEILSILRRNDRGNNKRS